MMPDINAGKLADGSVLITRQKLLLKRILVELLSGPGVPGRSIRYSKRWRAATQKYPDFCVLPASKLPGPATGSSWDFPGLAPRRGSGALLPTALVRIGSAFIGNRG